MKALTKRISTSFLKKIEFMREQIEKRSDELDLMRMDGSCAVDADDFIDELSEMKEYLNSLEMLILNPEMHRDIDEICDEYSDEKEDVKSLNEGESALLALYRDLYPHRFTQEDVDKKIYELKASI